MKKATNPIRIMHLVNWLDLAGMEYGVIKLVNRLSPERFQPIICCLLGKGPIDELIKPHVKIVELGKRPGFDLRIPWKLTQLTKTYNVNIIHSHNWATYPYAIITKYANNSLHCIHGEHGRDTSEWSLPRRQRYFMAFTKNRVEYVTTVANHLADEYSHTWHFDRKRILVIHNGVDLDAFKVEGSQKTIRQSLGLDISGLVIGIVGRLRPIKDPKTLFTAVAEVARQRGDVTLVVVGWQGGPIIAETLKNQAQQLCRPAKVVFLGLRKDIPKLMRCFDIYVNSSIYEGMSNSILEAMASNCPVIATDIPGNREILTNGKLENLFPVGNSLALAEKIKLVAENDQLRHHLIQSQWKLLRTYFTIDRMVERYEKLYQQLVK